MSLANPPSLGEGEHVIDAEDDRIRLLICNTCNTIEPLPDYTGPIEHDTTLQFRLSKHRTAEGHPHLGNMARVSEKSWDNPTYRAKILDELAKAHAAGEVGLGTKMYDLRSTFQEDAMSCWRHEHNRTENCEDFRSDRKRLVPDTKGERKELGLETRSKYMPVNSWLCDYCPYATLVMERQRKAKGLY